MNDNLTESSDFTLKSLLPVNWQQPFHRKIAAASKQAADLAIMIFSEICEYLGSGLKVPTEINGFLLSIDASLYQKRKIENIILC